MLGTTNKPTELTVKTMSTKELAEVLEVGESTVKRAVEKVRPVLGEVKTNSQGGYLFTEEQATRIKLEIQKHHNLQSRQIDNVSTELEESMIVMQAMTIMQRKIDEYQARAIQAEQVVNRIADGKGCYSMNQAAKALKLPYGNIKLFDKLRSDGVLNQDNSPKQEHINNGHFVVVVKYVNEKVGNKAVTLVTGKGLVYLAKRLNTEIDESVEADA